MHDVAGTGLKFTLGHVYYYEFVDGATNQFSATSIEHDTQNSSSICYNIISVSGSTHGIDCNDYSACLHNSVYSAGGTGRGISTSVPTGQQQAMVLNNLVEGFSGVGGIGIRISGEGAYVYGGNAVYDCESEYVEGTTNRYMNNLGDNEILIASPFNAASTGDFSRVDTGNVKEGALPSFIGVG